MTKPIAPPAHLRALLGLLFTGLAGIATPIVQAADPDDIYMVEIVVFVDDRATGYEASNSEQWRNPGALGYPDRLAFLRGDSSEPSAIANPAEPQLMQLLRIPDSEIDAIADHLRKRSRFRVLFEGSWLQELSDRDAAPGVPLLGGKSFEPWRELMGTVTLSKERYLHITADLWFSEFAERDSYGADQPWYVSQAAIVDLPAPPGRGAAAYERSDYQPVRSYTLQEFRRLRRDQLNYLDHPVFGAIVKLSRYEMPEEEAIADEVATGNANSPQAEIEQTSTSP